MAWGGASDPHQDEAPGCADLSDDVLDVYLEFVRGLRCWRAGRWQQALWEGWYGVHSHWGRHAVGAVRALHHAVREDVPGGGPGR